jgi:hypothetical protein
VGEAVNPYSSGAAFRADRLGRVCTAYARDLDPVSEAAVLEAGLPLDRVAEVAAAYALGGWRAVADLLKTDYVYQANLRAEDLI